MHTLILGARGMLGHALVRAFHDEDVTAWDKEHLDLTDEQAVAEAIPLLAPEVVINAAAYTDVERAEEDLEEADAVNGYAVGNLAVACADAEIPLLHVSTDYVFDGTKEDGYTEADEPMNPPNAYGRSKLLGETLLRENGKNFWLVRTSGLYGPHGKHFVDKVLNAAERTADLPVVADQHFSPTYTADLAQAIRRLLANRASPGVYHLVNSGVATWADMADIILRTSPGVRIERVSSTDPVFLSIFRAPRPRWSALLNTKRPALRQWKEALLDYLTVRQRASLPQAEVL